MDVLKNVMVLWSGGTDSTYLIYKYLSESHNVWAAYVTVRNNCGPNTQENLARRNLAPIFRLNFGARFTDLGSVASVHLSRSNPNLILPQAVLFPVVLNALPPGLDEIALGYMAADQFEAPLMEGFVEKVRASLESFRSMVHGAKWKVVFPLLSKSKREIRALLPPAYRGLVYCSPAREAARLAARAVPTLVC
jgi:hypothetical protein